MELMEAYSIRKTLVGASFRITTILACCSVFLLLPARVNAGFNLGDANNYAVLYEGAGNHNFTVNSSANLDPVIQGNVGIGNLSNGTATVHLNNGVTVAGDLNF